MTYEKKKSEGWFERKKRERGERAIERQLAFQQRKASGITEDPRLTAIRISKKAHQAKTRIEEFRRIADSDKILEVGSGAHGLVFGFDKHFGIGVDPLAVEYRSLFPNWQPRSATIAAIGEQLPFEDDSFEVVLSDNVIDHAADPIKIISELVRVLHPEGIFYFTVNTHHRLYESLSKLHGFWNAVGIKYEITPFADHTIHFSEDKVLEVFEDLPLNVLFHSPPISERDYEPSDARSVLERKFKRLFFKNSLFEIIATKKN